MMKFLLLPVVSLLVLQVRGHGRLMTPPARSSMWRQGFKDVPINYDDNQNFCGGFTVQWETHGGQCGVCGDEYGGPYKHEKGGEFYTDKIAGSYTEGQEFKAIVELTTAHKGWFEFRLCADDAEDKLTHDCLNKHLLQHPDGATRQEITKEGSHNVTVHLVLPGGVTCDFCVLQWKYHAGNSWGVEADGHECLGCGPQEEFYGCANIAIKPAGGGQGGAGTEANPGDKTSPKPSTEHSQSQGQTESTTKQTEGTTKQTEGTTKQTEGTTKQTEGTTKQTEGTTKQTEGTTTQTEGTTQPTTSTTSGSCRAAEGPWKNVPNLASWCDANCSRGFCPPSHCVCDKKRQTRSTRNLRRSRILERLQKLLSN